MSKVTLWPTGQTIDIDEKTTLLEGLTKHGIYIKSSCGGHATCSDCVVKVTSGEDSLSPTKFDELKILGNVFHITRQRLSCQTYISGDVTLDVSHHDKERDEAKMQNKTRKMPRGKFQNKNKLIKKTTSVAPDLSHESEQAGEKKPDAEWFKHWEKKESESENQNLEVKQPTKKKLGGNRRPKFPKFKD